MSAFVKLRPAAALRMLGAGHAEIPDARVDEPLARSLIAESLVATGREEDALWWYESIAGIGLGELPYRAPATERLAQIYAYRGDRKEAALHYSRFIDLWRNADPELQPRARAAAESLRTGRAHAE